MSQMLNTFDVPDVFATRTWIEDAGGGCVRVYNCIEKDGNLIPVGNAVVFPAKCILGLAESAQAFAAKIAAVMDISGRPVH